MNRRRNLRIETLEARDVPATFFASPLSETLTDAGGSAVSTDVAAVAAADAVNLDAAVFLRPGDKLVFDANFNGKKDAGDTVLASVTAGEAFAFFENDEDDGVFSVAEFRGVAVSDGFVGSLRGENLDVFAGVVDGEIEISAGLYVVPRASIAGLTVVGSLDNVGAGGDIANVTVTAAKGSFTSSAQAIRAGTEASSTLFFKTTTGTYVPAVGEAGASIRNLRAARGIERIFAGNGGTDGVGGSIAGITFDACPDGARMEAGRGGDSLASTGPAGGSIAGVRIVGSAVGFIELQAGDGGAAGTFSGDLAGGAGGRVADVTLAIGQALSSIRLLGGNGGIGRNGGSGGVGGAVVGVRGNVVDLADDLLVQGGSGGNGGPTGAGGIGGAVLDARLKVTGTLASDAHLFGGRGGLGSATAASGAGGEVEDISFQVAHGSGDRGLSIVAGAGGDAAVGGVGGDGGGIARVTAKVTGGLTGGVVILAGNGGGANETGDDGAGGNGGAVADVTITGAVSESVAVAAGNGGDATDRDAGDGGDVDRVTISGIGIGADSAFQVVAGEGGGADVRGDGGEGGSARNVILTLTSGVSEGLAVYGGSGGNAADGVGGTGGDLADVRASIKAAAVAEIVFLSTGRGGFSVDRAGGAGGSVERVSAANAGRVSDIFIASGSGGDVLDGGALAGDGGDLLDIAVVNAGSLRSVVLQSGNGGDDDFDGTGGDAGEIRRARIHNKGSVDAGGAVSVDTGSGGDVGTTTGDAGDGGAIAELTYLDPKGTAPFFVQTGVGGDGGASGTGGAIDGVSIAAPRADVKLETGEGGTNGISPGHGGAIGGVRGSAGFLSIETGNGGSTNLFGFSGGDGGAIDGVDVAVTFFAQRIMTGSGGNAGGAAATVGGDGGRIANVAIRGRGDIGNFNASFGADESAMGGLIAGLAGSGGGAGTDGVTGSIEGITARRIAAIFAGNEGTVGGNLTAANAVTSIRDVTANVIGADIDGDGEFDFIGPGGFDVDVDEALDGFVLVTAGGFDADTVSVDPLLVVEA